MYLAPVLFLTTAASYVNFQMQKMNGKNKNKPKKKKSLSLPIIDELKNHVPTTENKPPALVKPINLVKKMHFNHRFGTSRCILVLTVF